MVFDRKLKLKVEFKSKMSDFEDDELIHRNPHFSFEGEKMVWFKGKFSISLIDLRDLSQVEYNNLIPYDPNEEHLPEPRFSVADFKREKILLYYEVGQTGMILYQEERNDPHIYSCSDCFDTFERIEALDLTEDKNFVICGGSDNSKATFIAGFSFEKTLTLMGKKTLQMLNCSKIHALAFSKSKDDLLFASTDGPFLVLGLDLYRSKIDLLKIIDIHMNCKTITPSLTPLRLFC